MKIAKVIAFLCLSAMTIILFYALMSGNFVEEGRRLLSMPWGIVSLVDLYAGFTLFSCWIAYRERSISRSMLWIFLVMVLGFWAGALYTVVTLELSGDDWEKFFLGRHQRLQA